MKPAAQHCPNSGEQCPCPPTSTPPQASPSLRGAALALHRSPSSSTMALPPSLDPQLWAVPSSSHTHQVSTLLQPGAQSLPQGFLRSRLMLSTSGHRIGPKATRCLPLSHGPAAPGKHPIATNLPLSSVLGAQSHRVSLPCLLTTKPYGLPISRPESILFLNLL